MSEKQEIADEIRRRFRILEEEIAASERRHKAELAAKDRELEWLRLEQLHFFETIGRLRLELDARDL